MTKQPAKDRLATCAAVRERDGMKCVKCGLTNGESVARCGRQLDVHRVISGSLYTVDGCISECKTCHGKLPRRPSGKTDLARPGVFFELSRELMAAFNEMCARNGTTFRFELEDAMRRHLAFPPRREPEHIPPTDADQPPAPPKPRRGKRPPA